MLVTLGDPQIWGGSDAQDRLVRRRACDAHGGRSDCPRARNRQSAARGSRQANPSDAIKHALAKFARAIKQALARYVGRDGVALSGRTADRGQRGEAAGVGAEAVAPTDDARSHKSLLARVASKAALALGRGRFFPQQFSRFWID